MRRSILHLYIATLAAFLSSVATESRVIAAGPKPIENKTEMYRSARTTSSQASQEWAGLSDAQIQRKARIIVTMEVMRYIQMLCQPRGGNAPQIEADLTMSFRPDGFLLNVVRKDASKSIGSPADEVQKCIVQSVRMASPYHGLDPKYFDIWKSLSIRLRARG
jgi:hypothetical protein